MSYTLDEDSARAVIELARELTGANVNLRDHSVIVQNLVNRVEKVGCKNLSEYFGFVERNDDEMDFLVSALTIHTTSWFREMGAFDRLVKLTDDWTRRNLHTTFRVLSVGCSTGEEVYSLGATLEVIRQKTKGFDYAIDGWDIDPISLKFARTGIYESQSINTVPAHFREILVDPLFDAKTQFRVHESIRSKCRFRTVNAIQPPFDTDRYHYIICRNMLIYFSEEAIHKITSHFKSILSADGTFCSGVSEVGCFKPPLWFPIGNATFSARKELISDRLVDPPKVLASAKNRSDHEILVAEDDSEIRNLMTEQLEHEGFKVTAVKNATEALKLVRQQKFDLIFSDYHMEVGHTGLDLCVAARAAGFRGNFVLVTGFATRKLAEDGLKLGCDEVIAKPFTDGELVRLAHRYCRTERKHSLGRPELILMGASTGGTEVLVKILRSLPPDSPPVAVVQHITSNFASDFGLRLAHASGLELGDMLPNEEMIPGKLYIATGDYHIGVRQELGKLRLVISQKDAVSGHRPSVDVLFESAAMTQKRIFAALLTGMGRDGARGLLTLRESGAVTFAQNQETSVVFGMPGEAIRLGAAKHIAGPEEIRTFLIASLTKKSQSIDAPLMSRKVV